MMRTRAGEVEVTFHRVFGAASPDELAHNFGAGYLTAEELEVVASKIHEAIADNLPPGWRWAGDDGLFAAPDTTWESDAQDFTIGVERDLENL